MDVDLRPVEEAAGIRRGPVGARPDHGGGLRLARRPGQAPRGLRLDPVQAELPRGRGRQAGRGHRRGDRLRPAPLHGDRPGEPRRAGQAGATRNSPGWPWSRGCPAGTAASGGSTSCTGRRCPRWEQATGREYEQALPGGESDARNTEAARELILELFRIWDELDARRALPEELYVLELGVGNGNQARTWLDEFVQLDRRHGRDYYHRLHYLMGDYSPHVLDLAQRRPWPTTPSGSARW